MEKGTSIDGVILTPLKQIIQDTGFVYHAMKKSSDGYAGFGEVYFSGVKKDCIKGWKRHNKMVLNLVVPVGEVKFVLYDSREGATSGNIQEIVLSSDSNYQRLTVPPGVWMSFCGRSEGLNLLQNCASIEHDPAEADILPLETEEIPYRW
ncbi:MAG: dTDP-4-dehydrorhamnose 3,5-epimerase family protein [Spirochaetales bacterium]|nr:dTDP-4-dehydrorhamnose 3,5-epimerase family protein [Spirochaetales bacterium]